VRWARHPEVPETAQRGRRVAAVILAAGSSSRLGYPKQLVRLDRNSTGEPAETLLQRTIRMAQEAGCEPVVVVLGCYADEIETTLHGAGVIVTRNQEWTEGMASSVCLGVGALAGSGVDGVVLLTCDQPAITPLHLRMLGARGEVTASSYAGRRGVPAFFPAASFPQLQRLHGDQGARELLRKAAAVELVDGELDVDTPESLALARARFQRE
jgi:molybdenum cofactor cytidylyltransferase